MRRPKKKSCMRRSTDAGCPAMITTKAVRDVITIADIEALEGRPYDELIPARMLIDLLRATAHAHPDRPAITTVPRGGFSGRSSTMSHRDLYKRVVRAANFFDGLMQASGGHDRFPRSHWRRNGGSAPWRADCRRRQYDQLSSWRRRNRGFAGRRECVRSCPIPCGQINTSRRSSR